MYVTPERFKTMGFGVDLDDLDVFELRATLRRAADRVNAICGAPGLPQPHDFRGGTITDERHIWKMGDGVSTPPSRSIYLWHYPIRTVTSLRIDLTNNRYVDIGEDERYLTNRTVEIVSLAMTASGLYGAAVVPEIGLLKPRIKATYTYGYSIPTTGEVLEPTDGKTYRAQDQWWTDDTVTVYVDGNVVTTGFTLDRDEGTVIFTENKAAEVKADYTTKLPRNIQTATGILAAEALGDREMRARGMSGLRRIQVGEIALEKDAQMRGSSTLITPAVAEAEALLEGFHFVWAAA